MPEKYVIVGNSAAAVGAVEAIRRNDRKGSIVIFSKEVHHTYSRPLISYYNLGKVDEKGMAFRNADFYKDNGCDFRSGVSIAKIDPAAKCVCTISGRDESYGKLLLATGSEPVLPPFSGLDSVSRVLTYTRFDDAKELEIALQEGASRVLIVGAGLIGLKCAEGIRNKANVTCVDLSPRVLSSILDNESSDIVGKHIQSEGVELILNTGVRSFNGNTAVLSDGRTVSFDVLVVASGVRPCTDLLKDIGGAVSRGIVVDTHCKTSVEDIYAAGDCTETVDLSTGERKVMALLPNAYMQGECAGMNMSGTDHVFDKAIPMNALTLFGLHIMTAGSYRGESKDDSIGSDIRRFYHSDDHLNGYILVGEINKAGIYTSLIRERVSLSSIDFDLIRRSPGLMAFGRSFRDRTLGGGPYDN